MGLETYWAQFAGLESRLQGYNREITARLAGFGAEVVNLGMVDNAEEAMAASHAKVPVIVLNLSPLEAID